MYNNGNKKLLLISVINRLPSTLSPAFSTDVKLRETTISEFKNLDVSAEKKLEIFNAMQYVTNSPTVKKIIKFV